MSTFFLVYIIINNNERWGEEEEDIEWCDSVKIVLSFSILFIG